MSEDLYYTSGAGPSASASSRFERNRYESSGPLGITLFIRSQKTIADADYPSVSIFKNADNNSIKNNHFITHVYACTGMWGYYTTRVLR